MNLGVKLLAFATLIFLMVGLAGIIGGCAGDSWWVDDSNYKEGLWRKCNGKDSCFSRNNILEFQVNYRDLDAMFIVLIVSAVTSFFAIINLLVLVSCCRDHDERWKCATLLLTLNSFSAAVAGLGPCIYAEVQFKDEFDIYDHGWSIIFAWVGACCLVISFILSFVLICNGPEETEAKEIMRTDNSYPM